MSDIQNECKRCGICCTKGGPALHSEDLYLVKSGKIPRKKLITIRKGELVFKPSSEIPQTADCELIKIVGTGKDWQCFFFDTVDKGCKIYGSRPVACSTLQCWDTEKIEKLVEEDTLSRLDIVGDEDPMFKLIKEHERKCPCPDMLGVLEAVKNGGSISIESLEELVNKDIQLRQHAEKQHAISLADELFFFGRPIFQLLQQLGVQVSEVRGKLRLRLS